MENQRDKEFVLPKNIRQMGKLGETYKIYVEDFVYTYVHRTLREEQKNPDFVAAVLGIRLGKHIQLDVVRVTTQLCERILQIVNFIFRQCQAKTQVSVD